MNKRYKTAGITLALLLTGCSAFANNNVSYVSDGFLVVLVVALILLLLSTFGAFVIAGGNISLKVVPGGSSVFF